VDNLRDAPTKFFHANASIKFRRNLITTLENSDGQSFTEHSAKANLIWDSFKERLGVSSFQSVNFHLPTFIHLVNDLSFLVNPILKDEIDSDLPFDKAPSPDDFNIDFLRDVGILFPMIFITCAPPSSMGIFAFRV